MSQQAVKKLVLVLETSTSITEPNIEYSRSLNSFPEHKPELQCIFYILYPIQVKKQLVEALIDSDSEVNMMNQAFARKLGLRVYKTKINTPNINSSKLDNFGIVIAFFLMENKKRKFRFFEKTFLLANISMDIALGIPSLTLSNVKVDFVDLYIHWTTYIITKVLLTKKQVELIGKKDFAAATLDLKNEAFVVHVASISQDLDVYLS